MALSITTIIIMVIAYIYNEYNSTDHNPLVAHTFDNY